MKIHRLFILAIIATCFASCAEQPRIPAIPQDKNIEVKVEKLLKKMIRFLKNVKTDSEWSIDLSSFDINAICYDINVNEYKDSHYLDLVRVVWMKLFTLCLNETEANNLKSVDGTEYIFRDKPSKMASLRRLKDEVSKIYNEIK